MQFLNNILYFLITIGILVFIHELGHFLAAKLTGMRVDRFSIGFPPRAFGKKIGDTDYCVSWIPIGGYVKIAGMIDESFDTDFVSTEPRPWEFRAKPYRHRIFVITAGVFMNVLLAILIFGGINAVRGKIFRQTTEIGYVYEKTPGYEAGFRAGDRILAVNGKKVPYWEDLYNLIFLENLGQNLVIDLERDDQPISLSVPGTLTTQLPGDEADFGLIPKYTASVIGGVESDRPAERLGLQSKDTILVLNDTRVFYSHQVVGIISKNVGKEVSIEWKRGSEILKGTVIPDPDGRIGIQIAGGYYGPTVYTRHGILRSFIQGVNDAKNTTVIILNAVWQIITGKLSFAKSIAGPVRIAQMASTSAEGGPVHFLNFVALLSMSLAILNILPVPALDGGHLVFLLIEAVFRKEIPHRVKLAIQQVGFILLLAFMAFVIYNDIIHF